MANYFKDIDVTAQATFPTIPQVALQFEPTQKTVANFSTDSASTIDVSFDGINVHCTLKQGTALEAYTWDGPIKNIWLKSNNVGTGSLIARVLANN